VTVTSYLDRSWLPFSVEIIRWKLLIKCNNCKKTKQNKTKNKKRKQIKIDKNHIFGCSYKLRVLSETHMNYCQFISTPVHVNMHIFGALLFILEWSSQQQRTCKKHVTGNAFSLSQRSILTGNQRLLLEMPNMSHYCKLVKPQALAKTLCNCSIWQRQLLPAVQCMYPCVN